MIPMPLQSADRLSVQESREREARAQLRQAQKLESIGRLASSVAHDFNNILTVIVHSAQLLAERVGTDPVAREDLDAIVNACGSATELTGQLLAFSRPPTSNARPIALEELLRRVEKMLCRLIGKGITLRVEYDEDLGVVRIDPGQLEQVLVNLCVNARDAMPAGGHLTIQGMTRRLHAGSPACMAGLPVGDYVMLLVRDTGIGMTEEVRVRAFEPYFSTKDEGQGTGLGLATCYGIIVQSGGHIEVESAPGQGTTFRLLLPRVTAVSMTVPERVAAPAAVSMSGALAEVPPAPRETPIAPALPPASDSIRFVPR